MKSAQLELSVTRLTGSVLEVGFMQYTEAPGMLEDSFSKEPVGLVIVYYADPSWRFKREEAN